MATVLKQDESAVVFGEASLVSLLLRCSFEGSWEYRTCNLEASFGVRWAWRRSMVRVSPSS